MTKEKTAIDQLTAKFRQFQSEDCKMSWDEVCQICQIYKDAERQQIEQAVFDTLYGNDPDDSMIEFYDDKASNYFTTTYGE